MSMPDRDKLKIPAIVSKIIGILLVILLLIWGWGIRKISSKFLESWRDPPEEISSEILNVWSESRFIFTIVGSIFGFYLCFRASSLRPRDWIIHMIAFSTIPLWTIMEFLITKSPRLNTPLAIMIISGLAGSYLGRNLGKVQNS